MQADNSYTVQYKRDRQIIVKRQTEKVQSSARDGAFLTDDGRLFNARAEATGKARSPSVERLVNQQHGCVSRAQTMLNALPKCDNQWSSRSSCGINSSINVVLVLLLQLPDSFRQPHHSCLDSPPHPLLNSSLSSSTLSSSITRSLFYSKLKTHLFNKSFRP